MSIYTTSNFVDFPGLAELLDRLFLLGNAERIQKSERPYRKPDENWFRSEKAVVGDRSDEDEDDDDHSDSEIVTISRKKDDDEDTSIYSDSNHSCPYSVNKGVSLFEDSLGKNNSYISEEPPSLFDILAKNGWDLSSLGTPVRKSEEDEPEPKNPFVFIANRLTFLVKTRYPIIWETSKIETSGDDRMFIALDKHDNPTITVKEAVKIANQINHDKEIQDEISEYLSGTEYKEIFCMPMFREIDGSSRLGFEFRVVK